LALGKVRQGLQGVGFLVALSSLLVMGISMAPTSPAAAANAPSTMCSGFAACSQGTFSTHGYQNHLSTSYWTMYPGDNCTNYVAFVESTVYGVPEPSFNLGNGGQWAAAAAQNGLPVSHVPTVGSVAVWDGGSSGIPGEGHVAIVEAVGPQDSYIAISQQHMADDPDGYDWTIIYPAAARNQWELWPSDFIQFSPNAGASGPQPLTSAALAINTNLVLRVEPLVFANDKFVFTNQGGRIVTPGVVTSLAAGGSQGRYKISLQTSSQQSQYVLRISVSGPNIRVLHQGGPYTDDDPWIRITGPGASPSPAVVTVNIVRGATSPTTTTSTSTTTSTTTTTLSASATASLPASLKSPLVRLNTTN